MDTHTFAAQGPLAGLVEPTPDCAHVAPYRPPSSAARLDSPSQALAPRPQARGDRARNAASGLQRAVAPAEGPLPAGAQPPQRAARHFLLVSLASRFSAAMVWAALAGSLGAGTWLWSYNRENFKFDREMRQKNELKILEFRNVQSSLWREDGLDGDRLRAAPLIIGGSPRSGQVHGRHRSNSARARSFFLGPHIRLTSVTCGQGRPKLGPHWRQAWPTPASHTHTHLLQIKPANIERPHRAYFGPSGQTRPTDIGPHLAQLAPLGRTRAGFALTRGPSLADLLPIFCSPQRAVDVKGLGFWR